jgi:hypothetical protein
MWIKVDDKLAGHPKILRAGKLIGGRDGALKALGFFLWCLSYVNEYLTDGFISDEAIASCSLSKRSSFLAEVLSECKVKPNGNGLLIRVENGYRFNDYHEWNPTAEEAKEYAEKKRLAGQRGGLKSAELRKQTVKQPSSTCLPSASTPVQADAQANGKQSSSSRARSRPVPSRPVQEEQEQKNGAAGAARFPQAVEKSETDDDRRPATEPEPRAPRRDPDKPNTRLIAAVLRKEGILDDDDVTDADLPDDQLSEHDLEIRERAKESLAKAKMPYDSQHIEAARASERFKRQTGTRRGS